VAFCFRQLRYHLVPVGLACLLSCPVLLAINRGGMGSPSKERAGDVILVTDNIIRCPLREGETTFIVSSQNESALERLTVINENAQVRGELKIAVSPDRLSPSSEKWRRVEGSIRFDHKRRFNVSLLGIEARYVKLVFQVKRDIRESRFAPSEEIATFSTAGRF